MERYKCSIALSKENVNLESNIDLYPHFNQDRIIREHINFTASPHLVDTQFRIFYQNDEDENLEYDANEAYISCPWHKVHNGNTIIYASYPFIELQRQLRGYITSHCSVVDWQGRGIVLFGNPGAGKTSVTIDLCLRYGARLIGNDISIIGLRRNGPHARSGAKSLILRYESIRRNLPNILKFFPKDPLDKWQYKIRIDPADLGLKMSNDEVPINKAFVVHVDYSMKDVFIEAGCNIIMRLLLNENFSRYIRGTCISVLAGENLDSLGYIPSYDSKELYEFREELIKAIIAKLCYISGPMDAISDFIVSSVN